MTDINNVESKKNKPTHGALVAKVILISCHLHSTRVIENLIVDLLKYFLNPDVWAWMRGDVSYKRHEQRGS